MNDFMKGYVSGMFGLFISHPFDTLKVSFQENKPIKKFDIKTLYKGVSSPLLGVGLEKAIVFGSYSTALNICRNHKISDKFAIPISGAISGFTCSFAVTPVDRIKILLQTNQKFTFRNVNLFRGLSATFVREVPGFAIYFSVYDGFKTTFYKNQQIEIYTAFLVGGLSGFTSWFLIYPPDRIKTRMQTNIMTTNQPTFLETTKIIYKESGYRGFYRGFHFALMRAIPLHCGTFAMFEFLSKK